MVYDWAGKREICYTMYILENKALEEIMRYMGTYQTQFKRWGFPSKQNPAHKNIALVARIKQLWEHNTNQRDMLRILTDEGFDIKERELMRVRAKNRWLLRVPNGTKPHAPESPRYTPEDEGLLALQQEVYKNEETANANRDFPSESVTPKGKSPTPPGLSTQTLARRQERLDRLKSESAERWASRKRRRRTRGWGGLPADPPGPPRFPSETTIDESKQYLRLDNKMYRDLRERFQQICQESGFIKKTIAGPEKWQAAKTRLVQEIPHLQQLFEAEPTECDAKALALDVVCTDVTKRMRTLERRMTIAEAKNSLGINPEESRQIRNAFYDTLKTDHFTSKLEAGDEHWQELKAQWIRDQPLLQQILGPGNTDPQHTVKLKALEVLCRDVMKRLRDDQSKRNPARKSTRVSSASRKQASSTAAPAPNFLSNGISNGISTLASQALASAPITASEINDMQIDPSLLEAANGPSTFSANSPPEPGNTFEYVDPMLSPSLLNTTVSFQGGLTIIMHHSIRSLGSRSYPPEVEQIIVTRYPYSIINKIEGVHNDDNGSESYMPIGSDHELDMYLSHCHERRPLLLFTLGQIE
ncbi:hypothetical protein N7468_006350 [Penicillium chermesinum]|uniref:Clr5 domain-containing protein n=1 Tax=Penicillium chermesinum TaxID=63820 RepID=A0A9W9TL18_9EURO|nr:uncharacterized protein N7468_006350 [Penicillium chermesinum]KAJ5225125.1 hypothetical protein N7468_006350 [Penicillium chermesinum]